MDSSTGTPKVAIVGAGVVGLSIAWRLAQAGCAVSVFDQARAGRGASWAAAGMLGASAEAPSKHDALRDLGHRSLGLWPSFATELSSAASLDLGLCTEGTVFVGRTSSEVEWLKSVLDRCRAGSRIARELTQDEIVELEPELTSDIKLAALCKSDIQVDPRQVVTALQAVVELAGAAIHEHARVDEIVCSSRRVEGIKLVDDIVPFDTVVVAAGFESARLTIQHLDSIPTRPVRGQIVALNTQGRDLTSHVVRSEGGYMVPRSGGRLLVGATSEAGSTACEPSPGDTEKLLAFASDLLPRSRELEILDQWAGIRPGTPDGLPILGPCEIDGLLLATGHYRNGVLLAPASADLISRFVVGDEWPRSLEPFSPSRFGRAEPSDEIIASSQRKLA